MKTHALHDPPECDRHAGPPAGDGLPARVQAALQGTPWQGLALAPLPDKGLAHDHLRLVGTTLLVRVPKQSQMGLAAADNLAYQAACFQRASAGGHAPALHAVLAPSPALPRGALVVDFIEGRNAALPQDLPAIVRALAALHALPLPAPTDRPPLQDAADPLQALHDEIAAQAVYLDRAAVDGAVRQGVADGMAQLRAACAQPQRPARHLIAFDGHPGNFIVRTDGRAVLVDLEKCRYGYPSLDLAHATLYTSTTWDVDTHAVLSLPQVLQAYAGWAEAVGAPAADAARPWHVPLRRAMWLWSLTWCAKWRVLSTAAGHDDADGEDWSASHSQAALVAHVRGRVDHYLSPVVVAQVQAELVALDAALR